MNKLFCGDNLDILRQHIPDESVDLIYLDPPFNSKSNYNFSKNSIHYDLESKTLAFKDIWQWTSDSTNTLEQLKASHKKLSQLLNSIAIQFEYNNLSAYLVMMAIRLVELYRVLKLSASFYLHCDPSASHYLKVILDTIFDVKNFKNEIVWKRTGAHNDSSFCGKTHDVLFVYTKSSNFTWNKLYQPYKESYLKSKYRHLDSNGRRYRTDNLTAAALSGGGYTYAWNGITKVWLCPQHRMQQLHDQGRIKYTKNGMAEYIRYLDEMPGIPLQDVWDDIPPVSSSARERLGYPTQKPLALLDRIIQSSTNPGDIVLDPFSGSGTTLHMAQKVDRQWIGIEMNSLAIALTEKRLKDAFPDIEYDLTTQIV